MQNKTLIIIIAILIVVGLELFAGGYFCGVLYQKEKDKSQKAADVFKSLGLSEIISSFVVDGEVTKISGRTITLFNGIENFSITINEDIQVYSFSPGNQSESAFEAIKVGDNLSVGAGVSSDGQLEISGVIIKSF
jgi:hypothetical protein